MDTERNVSFMAVLESLQHPYLDMNPFFLLEFLELVHEDSFGHHSHSVCVGAVKDQNPMGTCQRKIGVGE